uniref:hypothetical protein n=1 Tax=Sulfolobus neozealandicus TaxID=299422 RepID=UPI00159EF2B7|nr:hypothetical protein [Sulfolobus neozealandicus]
MRVDLLPIELIDVFSDFKKLKNRRNFGSKKKKLQATTEKYSEHFIRRTIFE